jgi:hypothetical protein
MSSRFHPGTFVWGVALALAGGWMLGVGLDLWDIGRIDLRYAAPVLVILVGVSVLLGSLRSETRQHR